MGFLAPLMLVGALALRGDRVLTVVQLLAVAQIVALGLVTEAQPRYVAFAIVLLVICGVAAIRRMAARTHPRTHDRLAIIAAVLVVLGWIFCLIHDHVVRERRIAFTIAPRLAAAAIRADAGDAPCEVVGRPTAQLEWYCRCRVSVAIHPDAAANRRIYSVHTDGSAEPGTTIFYAPGLVRVVRVAPAQ